MSHSALLCQWNQHSSRRQSLMVVRRQSSQNHFSRPSLCRKQMEMGQKVVEQEWETVMRRSKSRAHTISSQQVLEEETIAVRVRHRQSLSWLWLLCPCSLHCLHQCLFYQQLQPSITILIGPFQSEIFYDSMNIYALPIAFWSYSGWRIFTLSGCTL